MAAHDEIRIESISAAGGADRTTRALDDIFFAASSVQHFADVDARCRFRERWLGRYLRDDARHGFVALDADRHVIGYVVGALDDPAASDRFADIPYFRDFAAVTALYPAHLHINLGEAWRGRGVGGRLITAFANHASDLGAPGVHIVTGAAMRNVGFYLANGFAEVARTGIDGKALVMLGRALPANTAHAPVAG